MQVTHQAPRSTMAEIADGGMLPVTKADPDHDKKIQTRDDRLTGSTWANTIIAAQMTAGNQFAQYAMELFAMTVEARAAGIEALRIWTKAKRAETAELHGMEAKRAARLLNSASTYTSQLATIANALQSGMTQESLAAHCKCSIGELRHVGLALIYEHAQMFSKAKAGRKADDFLTKMGKFLDLTKNIEDPKQIEQREAFVKLYNSLVK